MFPTFIQCIAESFGQNEAAEAAFKATEAALKKLSGVKIYEDADSVLCFTKKSILKTVNFTRLTSFKCNN